MPPYAFRPDLPLPIGAPVLSLFEMNFSKFTARFRIHVGVSFSCLMALCCRIIVLVILAITHAGATVVIEAAWLECISSTYAQNLQDERDWDQNTRRASIGAALSGGSSAIVPGVSAASSALIEAHLQPDSQISVRLSGSISTAGEGFHSAVSEAVLYIEYSFVDPPGAPFGWGDYTLDYTSSYLHGGIPTISLGYQTLGPGLGLAFAVLDLVQNERAEGATQASAQAVFSLTQATFASGFSQWDPLVGVVLNPSATEFANARSGRWFSALESTYYRFTAADGGSFSDIISFPVDIAEEFVVSRNGIILGTYKPGDSLNFAVGEAVAEFEVGLIGRNPDAGDFSLQLGFADPGTTFTVTSIPEPCGFVMLSAAFLMISIHKRRRCGGLCDH